MNVILEDDEQEIESSNSVSSVEEEKIFVKEVIDEDFSSGLRAVPYNNGLPRGIDVSKIQKMVNFIRKRSSEKKLNFFKPLAESLLPFDLQGQQYPVNERLSQSMQVLDYEMS